MKKHGLGQSYWNAHQVYSWVYTRNTRLLVLLSDQDEDDSVEPTVIDFIAMMNRPGADLADYAEAQEAIVSTLQEGRLGSLGRRREGAGGLEDIPAIEWVDLRFVWSVFHGLIEAVGMSDSPPSSIVGAPRWYGLRFKRDDVLELWPLAATADAPDPEVSTTVENAAASTRRRGRRPKYDWAAFHAGILGRDDLPVIQADLERDMTDWCVETWGEKNCPGESTIRAQVSRYYPGDNEGQ